MICFSEYVVPALCLQQGREVPEKVVTRLDEPFPADRSRHRFLAGFIRSDRGELFCRVSPKTESHMMTALAGSNGIIEAPPSPEALPAGTPVTCSLFPWRSLAGG